MSLSPRGKASILALTLLVVAGGALGYFVVFPEKAPAIVQQTLSTVGLVDEPPPAPPTCPLTGELPPHGTVPDRPVLAVKIENSPDARPQAGLQAADIVYEEPVEGGITRFIAVYQCHDEARVGPVRSARTADPDVLAQFGVPVLAYSGGAPNVVRAIQEADLLPLDETSGAKAFVRDPARPAPHNLYAGTKDLYRVARSGSSAPEPVFAYAPEITGPSRRVSTVHLPFSPTYSDVWWTWSRKAEAWLRSHGDEAHLAEEGGPVSATNVVVQVVDVVVGPRGGITPQLELTGSGKAYVFRDGRMIVGQWERPKLGDVTRFLTKEGDEIELEPGRTWVELFPSSIPVETAR
jgi:hypothetical protein